MSRIALVAGMMAIHNYGYDAMEAQKFCLQNTPRNVRFPTPGKRRKYRNKRKK